MQKGTKDGKDHWERSLGLLDKARPTISDRFGIEARAVLAWFDEFREKAAEYPAMTLVGVDPQGSEEP